MSALRDQRNHEPVNEYGIRVYTAQDRIDMHRDRIGYTDEQIARGVEAKRRMLETFRKIDERKAQPNNVQPMRRKRAA